jgi:hypothetical protein
MIMAAVIFMIDNCYQVSWFDKRNRYLGEYKRRAIAVNSAVWFKMPMIVLFC